MGLSELTEDVEENYSEIDEEFDIEIDDGIKRELTMLQTALDTDEESELVERAIHLLFQQTVETGQLDFHLRSTYDVTYDEYLSGMTYDEMGGSIEFPQPAQNDDRRYQF
jgi:hypothetical protein